MQIQQNATDNNWQNNFLAINQLRQVHKTYCSEANFILNHFRQFLLKCVSSEKTYIIKNTLALFTEMIMMHKQSGLSEENIAGIY